MQVNVEVEGRKVEGDLPSEEVRNQNRGDVSVVACWRDLRC